MYETFRNTSKINKNDFSKPYERKLYISSNTLTICFYVRTRLRTKLSIYDIIVIDYQSRLEMKWIYGMDIIINTTAKNDEQALALLQSFNFPIKKK